MTTVEIIVVVVWLLVFFEFGIIVIYNLIGNIESKSMLNVIKFGLLNMTISFIINMVRSDKEDKERGIKVEEDAILLTIIFIIFIVLGVGVAIFLGYSLVDEIRIKTIKAYEQKRIS